jgi:putative sterol carrier protein
LPARQPNTPAFGNKGQAMSRLEEITERMQTAVGGDSGLGKSLKFNLKGDGVIFINGGQVSNEDAAADLTMTLTMDDLIAIGQGTLDPMTAVMTGRLKLSDMAAAMALQGKIRALFSKVQ